MNIIFEERNIVNTRFNRIIIFNKLMTLYCAFATWFYPGYSSPNMLICAVAASNRDDVALLRIPGENPVVQRNRLLCRMNLLLLAFHVALEHTIPHKAEYPRGAVKGSPGQFTVRVTPIRLVLLVPYNPALRILPDLGGEIVAAPDDLIFRYPEQLTKILRARLFLLP